MSWFARRRPDEDRELLLGALDDALAHIAGEHADELPRLVRLRERLARPPLPTGLRRELALVLASARGPAAAPVEDDAAVVIAEMTNALVDALDAASLLDAELATHIDALGERVPPRIGRGDARSLAREAEALREVALPARERAERSRREIHEMVAELTALLSPTLRHSVSMEANLDRLCTRLAGADEPEALALAREELVLLAEDMRATSTAMREGLGRAMGRARDLQAALDETRERLGRLRSESERDALTGLLHRGVFDRRLVEAVRACGGDRRADAGSLCLVLLDIDHFKQVNDQHGHPTGDAVLRAVAGHLARLVRAGDAVGRVGGEEFGIVLSGMRLDGAAEIAERIRAAVEADEHAVDGGHLRVTLSAGLAELVDGETALELYKRADRALYEAKAAGRNRYVRAA